MCPVPRYGAACPAGLPRSQGITEGPARSFLFPLPSSRAPCASSDAGCSRALRAECEIGSCHLPACKTILDVVGDLFADVCQVEEFFLDDGIFGLFGKLSIRGRLLPEIVVPLHTYL